MNQAAAGDPESRFGYVGFEPCTSHSRGEAEWAVRLYQAGILEESQGREYTFQSR